MMSGGGVSVLKSLRGMIDDEGRITAHEFERLKQQALSY
jgi:hypothetical protein